MEQNVCFCPRKNNSDVSPVKVFSVRPGNMNEAFNEFTFIFWRSWCPMIMVCFWRIFLWFFSYPQSNLWLLEIKKHKIIGVRDMNHDIKLYGYQIVLGLSVKKTGEGRWLIRYFSSFPQTKFQWIGKMLPIIAHTSLF